MATAADRALELVVRRQIQRRDFNDRLAALDAAAAATPCRCECGLIACGAAIRLTAREYADVRAEPRHFAVLADHALPDAERVVATHRGWAIVEKLPGSASEIAVRAHAERGAAVSWPAACPRPAADSGSSPSEACERGSAAP
jgi:hypothetical protein